MGITHRKAPWLILVFSLPARQASQRVDIWRKLRRYGALPLRSAGYVLPNTAPNQERFEWLATAIRKHGGQASVVEASSIDDLPTPQLVQLFVRARARDYEILGRELRKALATRQKQASATRWSRLRRRFQEIVAIDFFESPLRSRVENLLDRIDAAVGEKPAGAGGRRAKTKYANRLWVTRPRPGIDRVASAWLIRRFIDPQARFGFLDDPAKEPKAIPYDMFGAAGFGHRGEDCTFETLQKHLGIRDPKVKVIAQIVHDADLGDEKFGRVEGLGLDRVLIGWAEQGISDDELLRRGMDLIDGIHSSLSS